MKLKDLLKGIECRLQGPAEVEVKDLQFDSRKVTAGTLFVAQVGTKVDGHDFIARAVASGAVAVLCQRIPEEVSDGVTYIVVDNSDRALGEAAANYYGHPSRQLKLVGITGTNGKTTTVTLLHRMFRLAGNHAGLISTIVNKIDEEEIPTGHTTPDALELNRLLSRMVLSKGDGFIVHSEQDERDLRELVSSPKLIRTVHPTYNQFRKRKIDKKTARKELGIPDDQEMLLFFGFIRKYKGLAHLIKALPDICSARPNAHLWVVGDFFENDKEEYLALIRECKCEDKLTLVDGYLPDDKVEPYFAAADLCVLPYESATQSGVIQISYSFGCPVVATNVGGLPEVVMENKTGYVVPALDDRALADAVIRFFEEKKAPEFARWIKEEEWKYSWDRMTENVKKLSVFSGKDMCNEQS